MPEFVTEHEVGWVGAFTREHAVGAIVNGTTIEKVQAEEGDDHTVGATGVVLGSIRPAGLPVILYFIEWHDRPRQAIAALDWKIAPLPVTTTAGR